MTSATSALVKIAMTEYAAGDIAGALALADPLVRWDDRAIDPDAELVLGQEDVLTYLSDWIGGWDNYKATIEEVREVGDRIVVVYSETGTERSTGIPLDQRRAAVVTVERGVITGWARYLTEREAEGAAEAGAVKRF